MTDSLTAKLNAGTARAPAYWICTVLVGLSFLSGGLANVLHAEETVQGIVRLGYPIHFVTILGVWKILGAVAVLAPRLPLLKEWAYAGMIFDLSGAAVAQTVVGGGDARMGTVAHVVTPLVLAGLVIASWALRPESRRLGPVTATVTSFLDRSVMPERRHPGKSQVQRSE